MGQVDTLLYTEYGYLEPIASQSLQIISSTEYLADTNTLSSSSATRHQFRPPTERPKSMACPKSEYSVLCVVHISSRYPYEGSRETRILAVEARSAAAGSLIYPRFCCPPLRTPKYPDTDTNIYHLCLLCI